MRTYDLVHLSDDALLRDLSTLVARDRVLTATLLAHLAEVDERRLYVPAGYPSMHAYCVGELRFSDDAAFNRITAARAARRFPILFDAIADGRLHVTGVRLLAPCLTPENAAELLTAASNRSKPEIERLLARRFGRPEPPTATIVRAAQFQTHRVSELAPGRVPASLELGSPEPELVPERVGPSPTSPGELVPERVEVAPSDEHFRLHVTIGRGTHDKLRYAQALLGHSVPSGDVTVVLDRALDALIVQLEKRKFGATKKPRAKAGRPSVRRRHIPAGVRRAVWERDQGRCTFESDAGRRCGARRMLEFDHADPVARGGEATVERIRLRCRAHNQFEAERVFSKPFMEEKRRAGRSAAESSTHAPELASRSETGASPDDALH
jgi:5-methylcytosine-specific restriction endonuclease McrA